MSGEELVIAIVITIVFLIVKYAITQAAKKSDGWTTDLGGGGDVDVPLYADGRAANPRRELTKLTGSDPDFSIVLLEDFLHALYAEAQGARGTPRMKELGPYVGAAARAELDGRGVAAVSAIVIGAMTWESASVTPEGATVTVFFEANHTETPAGGKPSAFYVEERWTLWRGPNAKSRPPAKTRVFNCPNCDAPLEKVRGRQCESCKQIPDTGELDWIVTGISLVSRTKRGPQLTGTTEERGTNLPTVVDRDLDAAIAALRARDPAYDNHAFGARVRAVFAELQVAWSARDWTRARPYVSDGLFQMQLYWIDAYKAAGLTNKTKDATVEGVTIVRCTSDRWYDAITVRLNASSLDFTVDDDGKVVGGSASRQRRYSEYWTLIRGSATKGAPRGGEKTCPNCAAELKINMAGVCEFCRAKVTAGDFDWVLSRIEQDEVYAG